MRRRRESQLEEVDERRLLRHRREACDLLAAVVGVGVLVIALVDEQLAGAAAIAALVDLAFELGDGRIWLAVLFGGDRRIELRRHEILERVGARLVVHALDRCSAAEARVHLVSLHVHGSLLTATLPASIATVEGSLGQVGYSCNRTVGARASADTGGQACIGPWRFLPVVWRLRSRRLVPLRSPPMSMPASG